MRNTISCSKCGKRHFINSGNYYKCHPDRKPNSAQQGNPLNNAQEDFGIVQKEEKVSEENINILQDYNVYRLSTDTMHNSLEPFEGAELYYYSTDTGLKELERRAESEYSGVTDDIRKTVYSHRGKRMDIPNDVMNEYSKNVQDGKHKIDNEEEISRDDNDVRAYLTSLSLEQLSQFTVDEVETISHYTADGSFIARGDSDDSSRKSEIVKNITSVFKKVHPRDDIPLLYRGTSFDFVNVNIGDITSLSQDGLPLCATTSEDIAGSFDKGVVLKLEIDEAKMVIPAAVSAWGAWEQEVLLDGNTDFKVVDIIKATTFEENQRREEAGLERLPNYDTYVLQQV